MLPTGDGKAGEHKHHVLLPDKDLHQGTATGLFEKLSGGGQTIIEWKEDGLVIGIGFIIIP